MADSLIGVRAMLEATIPSRAGSGLHRQRPTPLPDSRNRRTPERRVSAAILSAVSQRSRSRSVPWRIDDGELGPDAGSAAGLAEICYRQQESQDSGQPQRAPAPRAKALSCRTRRSPAVPACGPATANELSRNPAERKAEMNREPSGMFAVASMKSPGPGVPTPDMRHGSFVTSGPGRPATARRG